MEEIYWPEKIKEWETNYGFTNLIELKNTLFEKMRIAYHNRKLAEYPNTLRTLYST